MLFLMVTVGAPSTKISNMVLHLTGIMQLSIYFFYHFNFNIIYLKVIFKKKEKEIHCRAEKASDRWRDETTTKKM